MAGSVGQPPSDRSPDSISGFAARDGFQFANGPGHVGGSKDRGSCNERISAGRHAARSGFQLNPPINLESEGESLLQADFLSLPHFLDHFWKEGLAAESRFDGHDQQKIDLREKGQDCVEEGSWTKREATGPTGNADGVECGCHVAVGFHVDCDVL